MSAPRGRHRAPSPAASLHAAKAVVLPMRPVAGPDAGVMPDVDAADPAVLREQYRRLVAMYRSGVEGNGELVERLEEVCRERDALARRLRDLEDKSLLHERLRAARMAAAITAGKRAREEADTDGPGPVAGWSS